MHLLIRRMQRDDGWLFTSMTFLVDARLDLSPDEHELFQKYRLHDLVLYDSDDRVQHAYSAGESYQASASAADAVPLFPEIHEIHTVLGNFLASLWHAGAGATHSLLSALSLQVTLGTLVAGQHCETGSLEEIVAVEKAIVAGVEYLATYLDLALTYDGSEELSAH